MLKFETKCADILYKVEIYNYELRQILFLSDHKKINADKLNSIYKKRGKKIAELIEFKKSNPDEVWTDNLNKQFEKFAQEDGKLIKRLSELKLEMADDLKKKSAQKKLLIYSKERSYEY